MSISQFAEDVLGIKHLSYHQKEILKTMEHDRHERIVISYPKKHGLSITNEIYSRFKEILQIGLQQQLQEQN